MFKHKPGKARARTEVKNHGMYIHKALGSYVCELTIPVIDVGTRDPRKMEVCVTDLSMGNLTEGHLCFSLSYNVKRDQKRSIERSITRAWKKTPNSKFGLSQFPNPHKVYCKVCTRELAVVIMAPRKHKDTAHHKEKVSSCWSYFVSNGLHVSCIVQPKGVFWSLKYEWLVSLANKTCLQFNGSL